jgi:hypothetical protein
MVHRSTIIFAALTISVAPALAAPTTRRRESELQARSDAEEPFARNQEESEDVQRRQGFDLFTHHP